MGKIREKYIIQSSFRKMKVSSIVKLSFNALTYRPKENLMIQFVYQDSLSLLTNQVFKACLFKIIAYICICQLNPHDFYR